MKLTTVRWARCQWRPGPRCHAGQQQIRDSARPTAQAGEV